MSNAVIPASAVPSAPAAAPHDHLKRVKPGGALHWLKRNVLIPVASLRVTVVLFVLSFFLVFASTLAQVDAGIWTVVERYFRTGLAWIPFQAFVRLGQVFFGVSKEAQVAGSFPYPGGWLLGGLLLVNLLAAHALRFHFTWKDLILLPVFAVGAVLLWIWQEEPSALLVWAGGTALVLSLAGLMRFHGKRGGVILLHLGLIVMMLSELVSGLYAVEATMTIAQGETTNFLELSRENELAIIDRTNSTSDEVVVIPESMLRRGGLIQSALLPFDVVADRYLVNAIPEPIQPGETNPATAGDGLRLVAHERPEASGTDTKQGKDVASAYVTFKEKGDGRPLGTYLVSLWFNTNFINRLGPDRPQRLTVDGRQYEVFLRPRRTYEPYQIHLLEFRHDRYLNTDVARNFSSKVRLTEPDRNEEREVKIYMNHPLRYAGKTFYQSGVLGNDQGTVLQVVRNPGWLMPYISCVMVAGGMLIHFGLHLLAFLRRRIA
jgi:ResB-like family